MESIFNKSQLFFKTRPFKSRTKISLSHRVGSKVLLHYLKLLTRSRVWCNSVNYVYMFYLHLIDLSSDTVRTETPFSIYFQFIVKFWIQYFRDVTLFKRKKTTPGNLRYKYRKKELYGIINSPLRKSLVLKWRVSRQL